MYMYCRQTFTCRRPFQISVYNLRLGYNCHAHVVHCVYRLHSPCEGRGCLQGRFDRELESPSREGGRGCKLEERKALKEGRNVQLTDCSQFCRLYVFVLLERAMASSLQLVRTVRVVTKVSN